MDTLAQIPKYNLNEEQEKKLILQGIPCTFTCTESQIEAR